MPAMLFNREIGMKKIGTLTIDRAIIILLQMTIILLSCKTMIVESAAIFTREKKRHAYGYYLKNRQQSASLSKERDYDGALTVRDFFQNNRFNDRESAKDAGRKNRHAYNGRKQSARSFGRGYDRSDGLTRILSFPLSNDDHNGNGINGFAPGDPAGDCLAGGVDAGVVNGALKIGIGFGLAPGCGTSTEPPPPKMVPVPIYVPRPVPVPVAVPQPYPVTVDRPVPIRVPQPIPFPSFNMGSSPMMRSIQQFPSDLMTGKAWSYRSWK